MGDIPSRHDAVYRLTKIADASKREDGTDIPLGMEIRLGIAEIERLRAERESVRQYIIRNILQPHGVTRFHDDLLGICDQADHISATAFLAGVKAGLEAAVEDFAGGHPDTMIRRSVIIEGIRAIDPATITRKKAKPNAE